MFLVVITDVYTGSKRNRTGVFGDDMVDHLENRCFPGSVTTDQGNLLPAFDLKIKVCKQCLLPKRFGKMTDRQDIVAAFNRRL